ncbi:MAG: DNA alkylation repair protein [Verrucomicrobiales bacterium]|nr:DNA alkylation repair protein [Verrucomicrobiales bacterium]
MITTAQEILDELKALGRDSYKRMLMANYGVREPCFGVRIGDMKKIQKRVKKDYQLALDLYDTGNYDAMYLAGLIADDSRMTKQDLQRWVNGAYAGALPGATVAWVAAGSAHAWEMALKWIDSPKSSIAEAGWCTLASLVALKEDTDLDLAKLRQLIARVQKTIHQAPDAARHAMNGFIIAVGSYVKPLTEFALQTGERIGPVTANLGNNNCQVPFAPDYIRKVEKHGGIGKKRKTVKC